VVMGDSEGEFWTPVVFEFSVNIFFLDALKKFHLEFIV
jgi:hypothetical protein